MRGLATGLRMAPDGTLFAVGAEGIWRQGAHAIGADAAGVDADQPAACMPVAAGGDVRGRAVLDLAFDPAGAGRLYALGQSPRAVYVSDDGGATFAMHARFADSEDVLKLLVAPSRPLTVYAAGERDGKLLVLRSEDAGVTFAVVMPGAAYAEGLPLDLLGVHPTDPQTIFAALRAASGADEVWRSRDGGRTWARVLSLPTSEVLGGFTFGASGDTLYVGSREPFFQPGAASAQLYRSSDGGQTWSRRPSGARGPRYRCLARRGGVLFACAGGTANGDDFLLGSSRDEGATWTPLMTAEAIAGPEPCARATCAATAQWLCDAYAVCETDGGTRAAPDGGIAAPADPGGCGCAVGSSDRSLPRAPALLLVLWALGRRLSGRPRR